MKPPQALSPSLSEFDQKLIQCHLCPRLVSWRESVAQSKRAAFKDQSYWGKPVPSFGDLSSEVLILGLAPAAHGANRTGRMFTGDRSGNWLYRALHKAGFCNQGQSNSLNDGLQLQNIRITAALHCAPPQNKPSKSELDTCLAWLRKELQLMPQLKLIVALGGIAWKQALKLFQELEMALPKPKPKFGHLAETKISPYTLLGSYHPSQQNTFTGRLTEKMLDEVFQRAQDFTG